MSGFDIGLVIFGTIAYILLLNRNHIHRAYRFYKEHSSTKDTNQ